MIIPLLIKLTEDDKRLIISLCLIIILVGIIYGYFVKVVKNVMKKQGDAVDNYMYNLIATKIVDNPKSFKKVAYEKSFRKFYFASFLPFFLMAFICILILIYQLVMEKTSWNFIFDNINQIFFTLEWPTSKIFGITLISDWPSITKTPVFHFSLEAILSYVFLLFSVYSAFHYIFSVQALIARNWRIRKLAHSFFKKNITDLKSLQDAQQVKDTQAKLDQIAAEKQQ